MMAMPACLRGRLSSGLSEDRFNRTDVETVDAVVRWLEGAAGDDADDNLMIEGGILGEHRVC